jgi:hypothetical protein
MKPIQDIIERIFAGMQYQSEEGSPRDNIAFMVENFDDDTWVVSAIDKNEFQAISVAESDTLYSAFEVLEDIMVIEEELIH